MKNTSVIFDTNAYRSITLGLNQKESEDQFVKDMCDFVIKTANSDAKEWNDVRDDKESRFKAIEYLQLTNIYES